MTAARRTASSGSGGCRRRTASSSSIAHPFGATEMAIGALSGTTIDLHSTVGRVDAEREGRDRHRTHDHRRRRRAALHRADGRGRSTDDSPPLGRAPPRLSRDGAVSRSRPGRSRCATARCLRPALPPDDRRSRSSAPRSCSPSSTGSSTPRSAATGTGLGRLPWTYERWRAWLDRPEVETWVARRGGSPAGYFELERQDGGDVELAYFGLMPQFIGQGARRSPADRRDRRAWALPDTRRVWVHTCSLDHPSALGELPGARPRDLRRRDRDPRAARSSPRGRGQGPNFAPEFGWRGTWGRVSTDNDAWPLGVQRLALLAVVGAPRGRVGGLLDLGVHLRQEHRRGRVLQGPGRLEALQARPERAPRRSARSPTAPSQLSRRARGESCSTPTTKPDVTHFEDDIPDAVVGPGRDQPDRQGRARPGVERRPPVARARRHR